MRERGLKPEAKSSIMPPEIVAPHAGAWIETFITEFSGSLNTVAPHAGAWIETLRQEPNVHFSFVAPHAGAWIETFLCLIIAPA